MHPSSSLERQPAAEDFVRHCNALWNGRVEGTGGVSRSRNVAASALHIRDIRPNEEGDFASKIYRAIISMKGKKYMAQSNENNEIEPIT